MLLNDDLTYAEKSAQTVELAQQLRASPSEVINRLFFAARNGAISHLLRTLEHEFRAHKLNAVAKWKESSMSGTHVELLFIDPRGTEHTRRIWVDREDVGHTLDLPSRLVYRLRSIDVSEYYPHRTPKIAEAIAQVLSSAEFKDKASRWINGVNYPFTYESQSSF